MRCHRFVSIGLVAQRGPLRNGCRGSLLLAVNFAASLARVALLFIAALSCIHVVLDLPLVVQWGSFSGVLLTWLLDTVSRFLDLLPSSFGFVEPLGLICCCLLALTSMMVLGALSCSSSRCLQQLLLLELIPIQLHPGCLSAQDLPLRAESRRCRCFIPPSKGRVCSACI